MCSLWISFFFFNKFFEAEIKISLLLSWNCEVWRKGLSHHCVLLMALTIAVWILHNIPMLQVHFLCIKLSLVSFLVGLSEWAHCFFGSISSLLCFAPFIFFFFHLLYPPIYLVPKQNSQVKSTKTVRLKEINYSLTLN